jgi:hypothetical protein
MSSIMRVFSRAVQNRVSNVWNGRILIGCSVSSGSVVLGCAVAVLEAVVGFGWDRARRRQRVGPHASSPT